jgi:6-pyruvoyl-tetrahydropterin synthase
MGKMITITHRFSIFASHSLEAPPHRKGEVGDVCGVLHGHEYQVEICSRAHIDSRSGLATERSFLASFARSLETELQHAHLNDRLKFTSGEYLCAWIYQSAKGSLKELLSVAVQETNKNRFEVYSDVV